MPDIPSQRTQGEVEHLIATFAALSNHLRSEGRDSGEVDRQLGRLLDEWSDRYETTFGCDR